MDLGIKSYFDISNFNTVSVVLALALYPYIYLIVRASFLKNANTLLNPALSLGMSREKALFKVVLPLSRVAIVGGLSLVLMETISEYGVVSYYGVDTLSTAIFSAWFGMGDSGSAAYISSIAMIFILVILLVEKFSQGKARYTLESASSPLKKIKLKGIKAFFAYTFLSIPLFFGFILPLIWIVVYTIEYAQERLDMEFFSVVLNSFLASSFASFIIIILSVVLAYTYRIAPSFYTKYITKFATLGYSMPGAVIAIGIIILFGNFDNYLIDNFGFEGLLFSGTLFALLFGYIVRFLAVGLKDINIDLNEGEILTILGASGSGKSTILNLIAGFERPSSGTIGIYEKIVSSNEEFMEPHTRNVGFVFQNYALFPHLNVFKNISFGISDKETNKQKRVVEEMMKLTGLEGLEKRYPHELSGGQQQRVALARTLATKPKLILFDEAFSNVDAILKSKIEKELLCTT